MDFEREMSPSLKELCDFLLKNIPSCEHILVSNMYGLPILLASSPDAQTPHEPIETIFATVFAMTAEQLEKLSFGKVRSIISIQTDHILVQATLLPLVLGIVAKSDADVDDILEWIPHIQSALAPLRIKADSFTSQMI